MENYLSSVKKQLSHYKKLAEGAIQQVNEGELFWKFNNESNSIAIIITHTAGNMISRFTDFLTSDGEKAWRNRDAEFENKELSRERLLLHWQQGWDCLFQTIDMLQSEDLKRIVTIRGEEHTVIEALERQLSHIAYHVGQIVYIAKMIRDDKWKTLSIPQKSK
jgi:hypothetical protein